MSLVRYNPFAVRPSNLRSFVDEFFNRDAANFFDADVALTQPSVNIKETEDAYQLEVAAPGLEKKDFNLSVEDDRLKISAQKEYKEEETKERYTRREFHYSSFERTFLLPDHVNPDEISATYKEGILKVHIGKRDEAKPQPAKVIKVS